jgi:hypothetical protein
MASKTVLVRPASPLRARGWRLRLTVAGPSAGAVANAIVHRASGALRRKPIELDADGRGELIVPFGSSRVQRVTLTLANASTRFDCWRQELVYSCQGRPRDDNRRFTYTARATRR